VLTPAAASCAGSRLCLHRLSFCDVSDADEACCEDPSVLGRDSPLLGLVSVSSDDGRNGDGGNGQHVPIWTGVLISMTNRRSCV
jgi:hypothetical protein